MLEQRTIQEIEQLIITQLEANFNFKIPLLSKSFNRVLAKVLAGVWMINYKVANWIFLQMFVSTASFETVTIYGKTLSPLTEWGRLVGVGDPDSATQARLSIDITVKVGGETIPVGTQFKSPINGAIYITDSAYVLSGPVDTIEVVATPDFLGEIGNLSNGDSIKLVNTLGIINKEATVNELLSAGIEAETEDSYRSRIVERFGQRPQGGALVDYRTWSSEVPGVAQTYWYTGDYPTQLIGYVSGDISIYEDRIPDTALLESVGNSVTYSIRDGVEIADRKPPGSVVDPDGDRSYTNIKPIKLSLFTVTVQSLDVPDTTTVKAFITQSIKSYFLSLEPYIEGLSTTEKNISIQQSAVISLIQDIVINNNGSFLNAVITGSSGATLSQYTLEEGELVAVADVLFL